MTRDSSGRWVAYSLFGLATGLVVNSALGPLITDVIRYRMSTTVLNQLIALDIVSLLAVAPLAVLAGRLTLSRHPAGPPLGIAAAAFTAYMVTQTIVGSEYLGIDGNNERWFPLHLSLFVLSVLIVVGGWAAIDARRLPVTSRRRDRWTAGALFALAGFVGVVQWLPALADMVRDRPTRAGYLDNSPMTWVLALLDLGLATPAAVAAGVGMLRGSDWGRRAVYPVAGFFALVGPAVGAMALTMRVNDDPNITTANVVVMCAVGLALAALGVAVYRPLFARPVIPPALDPAAAQPVARSGDSGSLAHRRPEPHNHADHGAGDGEDQRRPHDHRPVDRRPAEVEREDLPHPYQHRETENRGHQVP